MYDIIFCPYHFSIKVLTNNVTTVVYCKDFKWSILVNVRGNDLWQRTMANSVHPILLIIIRCKCFFLFIGREPTTWPSNNCVQIMVCSCGMSFNCFWLQILFCSCVNETTLVRLSQNIVICQLFDLLATDKSRYFAQPRPIIANYSILSYYIYWCSSLPAILVTLISAQCILLILIMLFCCFFTSNLV